MGIELWSLQGQLFTCCPAMQTFLRKRPPLPECRAQRLQIVALQVRGNLVKRLALTTRESLIICTTTMWSLGLTRPTLELMLTASCSSVSPAHHATPCDNVNFNKQLNAHL